MADKKNVNNDIIDIDLKATARRKFRINGDNSRLVELDPSDISVITRIEEADSAFQECINQLQELANSKTETDDEIYEAGRKFKEIDEKMRELVDNIFQSNVSEVCAPTGSMYDPIKGKFRYEYIIEALLNFYQSNIQQEFKEMGNRVSRRTAKYTKKK